MSKLVSSQTLIFTDNDNHNDNNYDDNMSITLLLMMTIKMKEVM